MPPIASKSSKILLTHQPFLFYFLGRGFSEFSYQIGVVALGWQVYTLTRSAFDLGMVGLVGFIPTMILIFIGGHVADRYERKRVVQISRIIEGLTSAFLAWGTFAEWLNVQEIFAAVAVFGTTAAFESPALAALLPSTVPQGMLQKGTAITTGAWQIAAIAGPAFAGLAYAMAPALPYAIMTACFLSAAILNGAIKLDRPVTTKESPTFSQLFAGISFVRRHPTILGTISLDLIAVLLGGATALLPIYARDILHTGPWGLGVVRAAPAVGALIMTMWLAHRALNQVGLRMFQAVIVFGLATIIFAISHLIWLSIAALSLMGAADTVSVVIRSSLVQLATPDAMRGRVGAVNFLFINASNQLGEFESGVTAALFGTIPAALLGGMAAIAMAFVWMKLFPTLRNMDRLE